MIRGDATTRFLAIDPGNMTGWALADTRDGEILACGAVRYEAATWPSNIAFAIIEMPFVYPHSRDVDPNDLMRLARQVGNYERMINSVGVPVHTVFPREWKGQLDKKVHHPRILGALGTTEEKTRVAKAAAGITSQKALGDMLDAVGLAQWAFANKIREYRR